MESGSPRVLEKINKLTLENSRYQYQDFAILYRTNAQSRVIEEAFIRAGMPYVLVGGTRFYDRREIKDCLSYLRLISNKKDSISSQRLEKLGKKQFENFLKIAEELRKNNKDLSIPTLEPFD